MKLIYGVKDRPKPSELIVFALQQLLAVLAATIAVPAIIGHDMSQSAALFGSGVGTLVYLLFTKFKSPVFLGSSFAFLGSMAAAFAGGATMELGYLGLLLGAFFAGIVYVVLSLVVKFCGVKWISKLMPAVVIGPTVTIIGLSLAGNAVMDLTKTNYVTEYDKTAYVYVPFGENDYRYNENDDTYSFFKGEMACEKLVAVDKDADLTSPVPASKVHPDYDLSFDAKHDVETVAKNNGSPYAALVCGLVTLFAVMYFSVYGKKLSRMIPFILGILCGYAVAALFTVVGMATGCDALRVIDFGLFSNMQWLPEFTFIKAFRGIDELNASYVGAVAVAYIPVAFVSFAEHIADHKNLSSIIGTDLLEDPGLHRTLLGDGVGSMAGVFFGGCPNTTYGESVGCVAISGNASIVTIFTTALLSMAAAFAAPFTTFLSTIPSCVMGGVCVSLYGFIAVSGLKMLQPVDLGDNGNIFTASVILITGIGGMTVSFGKVTVTEVACALILGIIANRFVNFSKK